MKALLGIFCCVALLGMNLDNEWEESKKRGKEIYESTCIACHMGETTDGSNGDHTWVPTENTCITCHTNGPPPEVAGFAEDLQRLHDLLVVAGSINDDGSAIPGTYNANVAQATWNYVTLEEDKSEGVHNPNYARALLKNSIEALEN